MGKRQNPNKEIEHYSSNEQYRFESFDEVHEDLLQQYLAGIISKTKITNKSDVLEIASGSGSWGVQLVKRIKC